MPEISVLIPAYNEEALLGEVLLSVHESFSAVGHGKYEIVVCDNNSTDQTAAVARKHGARVAFEPHNQIARARNAAAREARGKWFIFLDADTRLNPELLGETIEALSSGKICAGGARVSFGDARIGATAFALTQLWNSISTVFQVAAGSYIFCLREAWSDVGGFDQEIYAGEELFFSRKLKKWGKSRHLRFRILPGNPVVTSPRKMEWYGQWELLRHMLTMMRPMAIKRRDLCGLWYTRPKSAEAVKREE